MIEVLKYLKPGAIVPIDIQTTKALVDALRQAIKELESQEPVAVVDGDAHDIKVRLLIGGINLEPDTKLYTHPPQRTEQEPVAWATREDFYRELDRSVNRMRQQMEIKGVVMRCADYDVALPIIDIREGHVLVGQVTSPPQRQPLTVEQIEYAFRTNSVMVDNGNAYMVAGKRAINITRVIEAAHGIKGEA